MPQKKTKRVTVAAARKEYAAAKRKYKTTGKAAFGKPASSTAKKAYRSAKAVYKKAGNTLGRLTGVKK